MTSLAQLGANLPRTFGELRDSGYRVTSVREEMRNNLVAKMRAEEVVFPGIVGFEDTVIPQLENAILAGQDVIPPGRTRSGQVPPHPQPGQPAGRIHPQGGRLRD